MSPCPRIASVLIYLIKSESFSTHQVCDELFQVSYPCSKVQVLLLCFKKFQSPGSRPASARRHSGGSGGGICTAPNPSDCKPRRAACHWSSLINDSLAVAGEIYLQNLLLP